MTQRAYRAACPSCGATVDFRSAASAFAVCSFCRSTLLRSGDKDGFALRRIGEVGELFDDHTPLQLGATGTYQGEAFTLVGRLQYRSADSVWNAWHALFDTGRSAWLADDNGRYVLAFERALEHGAPAADTLRVGAEQPIDGQVWSVAAVAFVQLIAALGELPTPPVTDRSFAVADLRNSRGEVGTLEYDTPAMPRWSVGTSVGLAELRMNGLADTATASEKTLSARSFACPNCSAPLRIQLASTQSMACAQCKAVVDVAAGDPASDLAHYAQGNPQVDGGEPLIPLDTVGRLALHITADSNLGAARTAPLSWQVVGYVERCEVDSGADADQVFWREYVLYHRSAGFAFLIDAEDGWSWAAPITGVPERFGDGVKFDGVLYRKLYSYRGKVTYVLGEFYWRLQRDQTTDNIDYRGNSAAPERRLNREQTTTEGGQEVVWSAGASLSADAVRTAFQLPRDQLARLERDSMPFSSGGHTLRRNIIFILVMVVLLVLLVRCSATGSQCNAVLSTYGEASQEYQNCRASQTSGVRTGGSYGGAYGGSYGGYRSGGGHK